LLAYANHLDIESDSKAIRFENTKVLLSIVRNVKLRTSKYKSNDIHNNCCDEITRLAVNKIAANKFGKIDGFK
jgi:hypothetical protein